MQYRHTFTISASTAASSPQEETLTLTAGDIRQVEIDIPAGHFGLAGFRILRASTVLFPFKPDEWYSGNDTVIKFDAFEELDTPPFDLVFQGYNTDVTYEHSFKVDITLLRPGFNYSEQQVELTKALLEKSNYPSEEWLEDVHDAVRNLRTTVDEVIVSSLLSIEDKIGEERTEEKSIEELSRI